MKTKPVLQKILKGNLETGRSPVPKSSKESIHLNGTVVRKKGAKQGINIGKNSAMPRFQP